MELDMLLTIGMIVKNEEKYLERCLKGIKPILDSVDSELIITDTGSTDRTVEIAETFTDKILHFEWIKDFSAARNTAFTLASGEWFMFLDADEIFESCEGIIDFFNSGEYKKYKSASFVIRNLYNEKDYLDFFPRRMVKRYPDTKFVGMIHEFLYPILEPAKHINDIAWHYGYLYTSVEESKAKFQRNIELMLKTLETEKDPHPKIYSQLFDGYGSVYEFDNAFRYLEMGIAKCKKTNNRYIVVLYMQKAENMYNNAKYDEVYAVCTEYFEQKKVMNLGFLTADGEMYAYEADSLFALGRCDEALTCYKKFFDIFRDIRAGKLSTEDAHQITFAMCNDRTILGLFSNFIACCINCSEFNIADHWLSTYPIYKFAFDEHKIYNFIRYELIVAEHFGYKNIGNYYKRLDSWGKKILLDELFDRSRKANNKELVLVALDNISKSDTKTAKKVTIYKTYYASEDCSAKINDFITQYGVSEDIDIIYLILNKNYDLSPALFETGLDIKKTVLLCCKNIDGFYEAAENYNADSISDINTLPTAVKFYDYCISMRLMENEDKPEEEKKQLIGKLFAVKSALNERYKKANTKSEFEQLAEAVKKNIRAYIVAGNIEAARKTLEDYKKINPGDPEINNLINMTGYKC